MVKLKFLVNRLISISLIFFIISLILNEYKIIEFSLSVKYTLYFLTFILIIVSSTKEIIINKSGLSKFINFVIIVAFLVGGVLSINKNQINNLIYLCILFSLSYGFIEILYKKA
ncbi:hypothetical protein [Clostridium sp.]|uniref:hypothetical protein n=1 Tax=Clostridium sp. TaxID=1506 RepID=UPI00261237D9|nr:hypothetical protein [Clostridium sp.]